MLRIDFDKVIFKKNEDGQDHMQAGHGFTRNDVLDALKNGKIMVNVKKKDDNLYEVYAKTEDGPYLLIPLISPMHDGATTYVITARPMTDSEKKRFRRF